MNSDASSQVDPAVASANRPTTSAWLRTSNGELVGLRAGIQDPIELAHLYGAGSFLRVRGTQLPASPGNGTAPYGADAVAQLRSAAAGGEGDQPPASSSRGGGSNNNSGGGSSSDSGDKDDSGSESVSGGVGAAAITMVAVDGVELLAAATTNLVGARSGARSTAVAAALGAQIREYSGAGGPGPVALFRALFIPISFDCDSAGSAPALTEQELETFLFGGPAAPSGVSMRSYVGYCSNGRNTFSHATSTILSGVTVPCTGPDFSTTGCDFSDFFRIGEQAAVEARSRLGSYEFERYNHIVLLMPGGWKARAAAGCEHFVGAAEIGISRTNVDGSPGFGIVAMTDDLLFPSEASPVLLHELLHNVGIWHSGKLGSPWGDLTCVMGNCCSMRCPNAPNMLALRWAEPVDAGALAMEEVPVGTVLRYRLPLQHTAISTALLVDATAGSGNGLQYYMSYRKATPPFEDIQGMDSWASVQVHVRFLGAARTSQPLQDTLQYARLSRPGLSWQDDVSRLAVTVVQLQQNTAEITLCRAPPRRHAGQHQLGGLRPVAARRRRQPGAPALPLAARLTKDRTGGPAGAVAATLVAAAAAAAACTGAEEPQAAAAPAVAPAAAPTTVPSAASAATPSAEAPAAAAPIVAPAAATAATAQTAAASAAAQAASSAAAQAAAAPSQAASGVAPAAAAPATAPAAAAPTSAAEAEQANKAKQAALS
ncbi:Autolysin [Tetrabaena socialis]|uniref:Autolysin n=1 Tax=Tetrabaena socialis TaxID=47790 RepID=A0A2J8A2M2_9CHLO|nr:Autolysin [Tetrabaena socialis]|eukprot:PNH06767.1 Autolysin [Tetrabaena socialis]